MPTSLFDSMLDRDERARFFQAFRSGAVGGITANWSDEIMRNGEAMARDHDANPVGYAAGELAGSAPLSLVGAGLAHNIARSAGSSRARFLIAALAGAAHGTLAGSGGFRPGPMSAEERVRDATSGAAMGATIGGLGVPGSRAVRDVIDNAPALIGRETLAEGGVVQRGIGQGTRTGAPLTLAFAGEGDAATRARNAIQAALSQDEGEAAQRGGAVFGRWANDGRDLRAFGSDELGQSVNAVRSIAAQAPAGQERLESMATQMLRDALRTRMRNLSAPTARTGSGRSRPLNSADAADLIARMDNPSFHASWLREAEGLTQAQRARLAAQAVRVLRQRATEAAADSGQAAEAFTRLLREPVIAQKLQALGVRTQALRGARGNLSGEAAVDAEVERLRRLATRPDDASYNFRNYDDRDLAARGALGDEDALAMLDELARPQRAYSVTPDRNARVLSGQYERGVRLNPSQWFNGASSDDVLASVIYAQPVAAAAPSLWEAMRGRRE